MKSIIKILKEIKSTSSNNEKIEILRKNKENELLKKILEYTYNPFKKYGLTHKVFELMEPETKYDFDSVFSLADTLSDNNINNPLRDLAIEVVAGLNKNEQDIAIGMLCKDLKIGLTEKSINKIFKGLIPEFSVQLATSIDNVKYDDLNGKEMWVTEKYDGIRCICIAKNENDIKLFTRNGIEINGLNDIIEEIKNTMYLSKIKGDLVLDGELLKINCDNLNSGDLYRETISIVNSDTEYKKDIRYNIFDIMTIREFEKGKSEKIYSDRRYELNLLCTDDNILKIAPVLYRGTDLDKVLNISKDFMANGKEGIMINLDTVYMCKRVKNILKVKGVNTADLEVVDLLEGEGKYKGKLGAFVCRYKDGATVNIGSGIKDLDREEIWNNKEKILGKIIEVKFTEESKNRDGGYSLRFPRFVSIRKDKDVADF